MKLACSPYALTAEIACLKDGQARSCMDYRAVNQRIKSDKFLIPKIEEMMDDMVRAPVFSMLNMFTSYWQVQFADQVQEMTASICKYEAF